MSNGASRIPDFGDPADVVIVGAGLAGLAAGIFAVNRGLRVILAGSTGGLAYTTGYLDLLGSSLTETSSYYAEPFEGIAALREEYPGHPYAKATDNEIRAAFSEFLESLAVADLPYVRTGSNMLGFSPLGTVKSTYAVPSTMFSGVEAYATRPPCLLIDFHGLKAFSAKGMAAVLKEVWPDLRPIRLEFPDLEWTGELYPEAMARCLEVPATLEKLAAIITPHLRGEAAVGLPAILGIHGSSAVQARLSALLGVPVFEIPTMPPGVPGIRLRECLDALLRDKGVALFAQRYVYGLNRKDDLFHVAVGESQAETNLRAKCLILATGRFLSGGLRADRIRGISESLLGLPLNAPATRSQWHREDYFAPQGHPINRVGVMVDDWFRPVDSEGRLAMPGLYAAGGILAHQDWLREKSGAGIALISAWKAVQAMEKELAGE